jgi:epoxyqueuosine reductase QueG
MESKSIFDIWLECCGDCEECEKECKENEISDDDWEDMKKCNPDLSDQ